MLSNSFGFEFAESVHLRQGPPLGQLTKLDSVWETRLLVGYRAHSAKTWCQCLGVCRTRNPPRAVIREDGCDQAGFSRDRKLMDVMCDEAFVEEFNVEQDMQENVGEKLEDDPMLR